jgi:hypothetical protein
MSKSIQRTTPPNAKSEYRTPKYDPLNAIYDAMLIIVDSIKLESDKGEFIGVDVLSCNHLCRRPRHEQSERSSWRDYWVC